MPKGSRHPCHPFCSNHSLLSWPWIWPGSFRASATVLAGCLAALGLCQRRAGSSPDTSHRQKTCRAEKAASRSSPPVRPHMLMAYMCTVVRGAVSRPWASSAIKVTLRVFCYSLKERECSQRGVSSATFRRVKNYESSHEAGEGGDTPRL